MEWFGENERHEAFVIGQLVLAAQCADQSDPLLTVSLRFPCSAEGRRLPDTSEQCMPGVSGININLVETSVETVCV